MLRLMSSPSPRAPRDEATHGDVALRDAGPDDAEASEFVHYAAREAVYGGKVVDWPPPGPDRPGRVERWRTWLSSPDVSCIVAERDGRIDMTTRDGSQCVRAGDHGQPECERHADKPDTRLGKRSREYRGATAAKNEPKCTYKLRAQFLRKRHDFPSSVNCAG